MATTARGSSFLCLQSIQRRVHKLPRRVSSIQKGKKRTNKDACKSSKADVLFVRFDTTRRFDLGTCRPVLQRSRSRSRYDRILLWFPHDLDRIRIDGAASGNILPPFASSHSPLFRRSRPRVDRRTARISDAQKGRVHEPSCRFFILATRISNPFATKMRATRRVQAHLSMRPYVRNVSCVRMGPVRANARRTARRSVPKKEPTMAMQAKGVAMWMLFRTWNWIYLAFNWIVDRLDYASEYRKRYYQQTSS